MRELEFKNKREPMATSELSSIQKRQLEASGTRWDGIVWTAEQRLHVPTTTSEEEDEGNFYGKYLELWDVWEDGKYMYDAWCYMLDSGAVFRAGTTDFVAEKVEQAFKAKDSAFRAALTAAYAFANAPKPAKKASAKKASAKKASAKKASAKPAKSPRGRS